MQVEVGVGVQNSGVIGAQTPYAAVRLERARTIEDVASPDGRGVVIDPEVLAVDGDAGFGARTLGVLSGRGFLLHLGDGQHRAAYQKATQSRSFPFRSGSIPTGATSG